VVVQITNEYGIALPSVPRPPPAQAPGRDDRFDARTCKHGVGDRMHLGDTVAALATITRKT
jgi:hypothetical protein